MNMNTTNEADEVCAACGRSECDDINLKACTACKLVKYCSVDCQKTHRPQHKKACKKRARELREKKLFEQPERSHLGDCPICFLPLPLDYNKTLITTCCGKVICKGCDYANDLREAEESLEPTCLYCRQPTPESVEEADKNLMERVKANDSAAIRKMASTFFLNGNHTTSFEYYDKAARLGDMHAHYQIALMYEEGSGVDRDVKKYIHHLEEASIGGHAQARMDLAKYELENCGPIGMMKSVKHCIIVANLGDVPAMKMLRSFFSRNLISRDEFSATLLAHQAAVEAMKSPQRETAERANHQGI